MSAPRHLVRGATYLITRRCTQRQFLLRPAALINAIFLYCLAYAAARAQVEIHGFVQMSNHWHGVVSDPEARLPEFLQLLHRLVACALNVVHGRVENVWAAEAASVVRLDDPEDVLDKLAYVIANPVAAGLVEDPRDWPGMITTGLEDVFVAKRPEVYFDANGGMPEQITLACTIPPALRDRDRGDVAKELRQRVRASVQRHTDALREEGRAFLGADAVLAMPTDKNGTTRESMRKRKPTFASRDRGRRLLARDRLRAFRRAYRVALDAWRGGDRTVRFPEGTYLMRVLHAAACGPPPLC